jgi:hypothetical protein
LYQLVAQSVSRSLVKLVEVWEEKVAFALISPLKGSGTLVMQENLSV